MNRAAFREFVITNRNEKNILVGHTDASTGTHAHALIHSLTWTRTQSWNIQLDTVHLTHTSLPILSAQRPK